MNIEKIIEKIKKLRKEKNTLILAHNYQIPEIQDIADIRGDSLELAKKATENNTENIIFCGVDFMAESAKILNPEKKVIIPDQKACCPMASMVNLEKLKEKKEQHPDAKVVAYINTTAKIKTESYICCTSSNGPKVVNSIKEQKIIFIPDKNLGHYIQRQTPQKKMILWDGYCKTHDQITTQQIMKIKEKNPDAEILVHPECKPTVIDIADYVYSTNGMVKHAKKSDNKKFIIATEKELCYRLKQENPTKKFYPIENAVCKNMKKITLKKLLLSLEKLQPEIKLSPTIMEKAQKPLQRMMKVGRGD